MSLMPNLGIMNNVCYNFKINPDFSFTRKLIIEYF